MLLFNMFLTVTAIIFRGTDLDHISLKYGSYNKPTKQRSDPFQPFHVIYLFGRLKS